MTATKYNLGGKTAITDRNNQIDYVNSVASQYATLLNGNFAAGASVFNGAVTAVLSPTNEKNVQVMKSIIDPASIWSVLSAAGDRIKHADVNLIVADVPGSMKPF